MQDVVGQIVVAGRSLRQPGDIQPVSMTLFKIGTPVNPYMAKEEEEGPKEDPLGPLMQNLRKMQAEEESAKVEGTPKKRAKNKISSAPEPSTASRYFHLLKDSSDEEEKDETPEEEVNLSALHECFLQKEKEIAQRKLALPFVRSRSSPSRASRGHRFVQ